MQKLFFNCCLLISLAFVGCGGTVDENQNVAADASAEAIAEYEAAVQAAEDASAAN